MAAFTINNGSTVNWDTLSGGSVNATLDTYTISNETTLLIDTDTYQCANHSTAFGSLDIVSFTGTGGRLLIDGRNVRVIAYTGGTGNVPAVGTTITQGGVSATFLGVWSGWQAEPTASGAAMPATGFIKVKNKIGGNFAAGALTGIGAIASGADVVGWIEVRGADTATITVPRVGTFEVIGDWFELGTTNGTRNQILACPTTLDSSATFPGVQIETAPGSGVYEWFPAAGQISGSGIRTTGIESKVVWSVPSGIRIGFDGTNNVGFLPPAGCRVRIPNVILTCCTRTAGSGSGPRVAPNATLATRQEWVTTGAGTILLTRCVSQWNNTWSQPFDVRIRESALCNTLTISEQASPIDIDSVCVSPVAAQINTALSLTSCFAGGTVKNSKFVRVSLASSGSYINTTNFITGVAFSGNFHTTLTNRANATTGAWTATQMIGCTFTNEVRCGGRFLMVGCINNTFTNDSYIDGWTATTGTSFPTVVWDFTTASSGNVVDGLNLPTTNNHPYNALVNISASYNTTIRNIGARTAHLSLGTINPTGVILSSGGNNSGIKLQRIYTINTRTGIHTLANSDTGILFESVFGDFADTTPIAGLNALLKGVGQTSATTGQVSVYGTHWLDEFNSDTTGRIIALMNEPNATTTAQSQIVSGTPKFNSSGQIALTAVGQRLEMEMPYFALGHTAAANLAPTLTGTNTGNLLVEFQYDKGAGYNGTWLTADQANWSSVGTITPSVGIRIKIRITCVTANAGNLLTQIRFNTISTLAAQADNLYPLSVNTVELTGLQPNTEVRAYRGTDPSTSIEIAGIEAVSGNFSFTHSFAGEPGYIIIASLGYENIYLPITYSASDMSFPIQQRVDRNYSNS